MRNAQRWVWGLVAGALVGAGSYGIADAQTADSSATHPDTSVGMQRQVQLSSQEQLTQADASLARMDAAATSVRRQLEGARSARDVVKVLCLNDKLNQVDVAIRSARDRRGALEQAANRRDNDLANHELTILTVLRQRVEQLTAEANQCIGVDAYYVGDAKVTTTIDSNIPQQDPSAYPENPIVSAPPVCASCVK